MCASKLCSRGCFVVEFVCVLLQFLQMKVTRLEHLVQIKDMKISELKQQIEMTRHHPLQRR